MFLRKHFLSAISQSRSKGFQLAQCQHFFEWRKSQNNQANAAKENEVTQAIKEIIEPITQRRIGALGCIQVNTFPIHFSN
jgi:DNA-binding transcriptional MerR regulator